MNILVPFKWLTEITKTNLDVDKISELLTLRSSSVEKITTVEGEPVLEVEITPNRGDALSVLGLARELYAILQAESETTSFTNPLNTGYEETLTNTPNKPLHIEVTNGKLAPKFAAIVLGNITIGESPDYIKKRLTQVDIRPINNVVDITNYIMMEVGQPMHAFDYDKISGTLLRIRASKKDEEIVTLDEVTRKLPANSIIIEDETKIIDLCGIMGGNNSKIDSNTKNIVLFAPVYDPKLIRKTSLKLNHRTDAALRFEKGIDLSMQKAALLHAIKLLKESCNYTPLSDVYEVSKLTKQTTRKVTMTFKKLNMYAGQEMDPMLAKTALEALGFQTLSITKSKISVSVPSHRLNDVSIEEDLIEEVIRIYGYEKIGFQLPSNYYSEKAINIESKVEREIKYYLRDIGYSELLTYSMVPESLVNLDAAVKIANPLNEDMQYMRTSLENSMNQAAMQNKGTVKVFELANVYKLTKEGLPSEELKFGILDNSPDSVFQLKNRLKNIFKLLNINAYKLDFSERSLVKIYVVGKYIGEIRIRGNYSYMTLDFLALVECRNEIPTIELPSKYVMFTEDITVHATKTDRVDSLMQEIKQVDSHIVLVTFKDDYQKEDIRAVTFTVNYQDKSSNITKEAVAEIRSNVILHLENDLGLHVDRLQTN